MAQNASENQEQHIAVALLDVETTGFSPYKDEVVEFSICLVEVERTLGKIQHIIDLYTGLRDPGRPIPAAASRVHGIFNQDVLGKTLDHERISHIFERTDAIVAHNASFDRGFVTRLFPKTAEKIWLCSMRQINWRAYGLASRSLADLLAHHGLVNDKAHRAQDDVMATLKLLSTTNTSGRTYFGDLLAALDKDLKERVVGK